MVGNPCDNTAESVGQFDMRIRFGRRTTESDERWRQRSEVLVAWLLDERKRQQREIAERN